MANSDKNILIRPNIGSADSAPIMEFVGADASYGTDRTVTLNVVSDDSGTLSFINPGGKEIFSVNNNQNDIIFSVNKFDDSNTPLMEINADAGVTGGLIQLCRFAGQVIIGGDSAQLDGTTPDSDDFLVVHKNIRVLNGAKVIANGSLLTNLNAASLTGTLPALNASSLTNLSAANLSGTLPALNGNALTSINAANMTGTINAGQLGGQSSANYLRSNTSDNFTSGTLEFQDNTLLAFGNSSDTIIEHDTGLNPDGTRFYANSTTGGMLFQDGSTTCFDVAYSSANQTTFQSTTRFNDNVIVYFGTGNDTYIRHNSSQSYTEFVANTSNGDMVFSDGGTAVMTIGTHASVANRIQIDGSMYIKDDVNLCFGNLGAGDTIIKHNTTTTSTQFIAGTDGAMQFLDGSTICFDVAKTAADTTTFFTDTEFRDSAVVCLDIGKTAPNTTTFQKNVDLGQNTRVKAYRRLLNNNSAVNLANENFFKISTVSTNPISFSNQSQGQAGIIHLDNAAGRVVSFGAEVAINADVLTSLSTAGQYMLTYFCTANSGNDTVLIGATGALT